MKKERKNGDPAYNIYQEEIGTWSVCKQCGREEIQSYMTAHADCMAGRSWRYLCNHCRHINEAHAEALDENVRRDYHSIRRCRSANPACEDLDLDNELYEMDLADLEDVPF